jgi:uncharacterized protein YkwD
MVAEMRGALPLILLITLAHPGAAAPRVVDEILAALQARIEDGGPVDDLVRRLDSVSLPDLKVLQDEFDRAWVQQRERYLSGFANAAGEQSSGQLRQENARLVRERREVFHRVRRMPEGPMKDALKKSSQPAMTRLKELLLPTADRILDIAGAPLREQRTGVMTLARFRDGLLTAMVSTEPSDSVDRIRAAERAVAEDHSGLDAGGLRIMRDNRSLALKAELPEPERAGIEELNTMRLLVGLPALRLDPKLCEAARGHSEDMKKHRFFSHTSPLPGKRTPGDRAKRAGTTGSGENIFAGSRSPQGANRGWFHSPGHHKNMFSDRYRRVGLGNFESHWTQMFGG